MQNSISQKLNMVRQNSIKKLNLNIWLKNTFRDYNYFQKRKLYPQKNTAISGVFVGEEGFEPPTLCL